MCRVGIIGCGIFGATIALKLQAAGHAVTVFERLDRPLAGASFNNQNRLHLGFHYPRDAETARQCIRGFDAFKVAFPDCVVSGFANAYFIASQGSFTTPEAYLRFCDEQQLAYRIIDPARFEPPVQGVDLGVLTDELVYDSKRLGTSLAETLQSQNTKIIFGADVVDAKERGDELVLKLQNGETYAFDVVINATYANISRLSQALGFQLPERQYEYTVVPVIKTPFGKTGITIMDGRFLTVLPFGASDYHLLYHVEHTVIATTVSQHVELSWLDQATSPFSKINPQELFERMRAAAAEYVPALADAQLVDFLHGPRMVLARRDDTDARPSIIDQPCPNYFTVFSGKIDHSLWVADEVVSRLQSRL